MVTARRVLVLAGSMALALGAGSVAAARGGSPSVRAEDAIAELTTSLPGTMIPVQGGGLLADDPACDVIRESDTLAETGEDVQQAYGGEPGGAVARIVILDSKKDAKRFFKLVTGDDAETCRIATSEVGLAPISGGSSASGDLERGKVAGVKKSVLLDGTISVGDLMIVEQDAAVRRGAVVIEAESGEFAEAGAGLGDTMTAWFRETAKKF